MIALAHPVASRPLVLRSSTAAELMTPDPFSVSQDMPISQAARLLTLEQLDAAPVIDSDGHLMGVVTTAACDTWQEFARKASRHGFAPGDLDEAPVGKIANPVVECMSERTLTRAIIDGFVERQASQIYVLNDQDQLVGVVTMVDVLRCLTSNFSPL